MKRLLKFLHEVGTVGLMGAIAAQLLLAITADGMPPDEYATLRWGILIVSKWLLLPSLVVVLVSGLLAFGWHRPYHEAPWAWMKAALTIAVLEGALVSVQGPARRAAELSTQLAQGNETVTTALLDVIRHERSGLWIMMALCIVNIALAVWRPRFRWLTPK